MRGPSFLRKPARIHEATEAARPILCQNAAQFTQGAAWRLRDLHDREDDLVIWITRGQGLVNIAGVRRGFGAHNALILPAGTLMALELGPQALAQVVQAPAGMIALDKREALHLRCRDALSQAELTGEIEAMQREMSRDGLYLRDALEAHLALISVWLRRQVAAGAADRPKEGASQRLAHRFAALVVRDHRSDRVMADYASALDVTPTHLTRVCKAVSGMTAAEMITERKLYAARQMLSRKEPSIAQVATDLGFHSAAYFTRFVQSHTGQTPSSLRRAAQLAKGAA
ncbi:Bifunctional transcriptional activator/DNA repair enzyme AdaA [Roseivivax sp. THAF40]|uniref:helix-turn-helix transcriptional regulator n=1 Tax=unclassified Roseivivax TaxID=2639302 RepID=UPI001268D26F|nr:MULTISPECIES: helix-turn-helix transcriptional regulator [unclassified Roseivivax]QFS83314.1 Bifunctional transcriptional activator/DNA repair enzyme AdaA [Roseivivax sp. THAF197b]QFT47058.1 Bifunctional transcriptional activator/DNA repair enzyme AdaA [Roseivivax sp. THAF40]